jgi:hypothetical protein
VLNPEQIARVCHAANRELQLIQGDPVPSPPWEGAPGDQRASAVAGVVAALAGSSPERLHEKWADAKTAAGWTYGDVKDWDTKTHPCLVPYANLPEEQQLKDALFAAVVEVLAYAGIPQA